MVFAFILFDYLSTLVFCRFPHEEGNVYARIFMENLGIMPGLTLFVLAANLPIYMTLSLNSHVINLPSKIAIVLEICVDMIFAWFIAGAHFNGGSSWFWDSSTVTRQILGAFSYFLLALILVKPHKSQYV